MIRRICLALLLVVGASCEPPRVTDKIQLSEDDVVGAWANSYRGRDAQGPFAVTEELRLTRDLRYQYVRSVDGRPHFQHSSNWRLRERPDDLFELSLTDFRYFDPARRGGSGEVRNQVFLLQRDAAQRLTLEGADREEPSPYFTKEP